MSVLKGIKKITQHEEAQRAKRESRDRVKVPYLTIKNDGDSVKLRFLQELDYDADNYSEKNGIGVIAIEHAHPDNFRNSALCTMEEEGQCYACEMKADDRVEWDERKGWGQKERLYINVADEEGNVYVLSQGTGDKSITPGLIEYTVDPDIGTITNRWFKVKRNGTGLKTSWTLTALKELGSDEKDVEEFEIFDIEENVLRHVPYARQQAAYHWGMDSPSSNESESESEAVSIPDSEETW